MLKQIQSWLKGSKAKSNPDDPFAVQKMLCEGADRITVFDVGAYVGDITAIYREVFPDATIYSFEPCADSFDKLKAASQASNAKAVNVAFSNHEGKARFHINTDPTCNSLLDRPESGGKYYCENSRNVQTVEVDLATIDDFCEQENIACIDILKLDIEGAEIQALTGARRMLTDHAVSVIYTEVMFVPHYQGGCMFHEIASFLSDFDFTLLNLYNLKTARNGQLRWGNAIFVSPPMRSMIETS